MIDDFLAGSAAGFCSILLTYPLDTLKTRVQTATNFTKFPIKHGIHQHLRTIVNNESPAALYRGMTGPILSSGLLNSLLFSGYTSALRILHRNDEIEFSSENRDNLPLHEIVLASMAGTAIQLIPGIPIELVKTKLQVNKTINGPINCIRKIVNRNGITGLYQGGYIMFYRDFIGYSFYIPTYESLREWLKQNTRLTETFCQLISGGVAGSLSWWIICPLEVIKNRLQIQEYQDIRNSAHLHCHESNKPVTYMSARRIARQIYMEGLLNSSVLSSTQTKTTDFVCKSHLINNQYQYSTFTTDKKQLFSVENMRTNGNFLRKICAGVQAFYRGGLILAIRAFPTNAIVFVVYEHALRFIKGSTI